MPIRKTPRPALLSICLFAVLGAGLAFATTGCGDPKQDQADDAAYAAAQQAKPVEYKLARLDENDAPKDSDPKVARFKSLLGQLSTTYTEKPNQIADMTVSAQEQMKKEGVEEPLLDIMEDMNQVFAARIPNQRYAEYVAAYITLREKGYTREKSVAGLQDLLSALTAH